MSFLKFPKTPHKKVELSIEEYREMLKSNPKALPKTKHKKLIFPNADTHIKSKTMKAVVPESDLQNTCNEMIGAYGFSFIRFEDAFMRWMSMNAPVHIRKMFYDQVGGKFPDNIIMTPIGDGFFLAAKLELKTEDAKGRAVGATHGKQKHYAKTEEWMIARNARQIESVLQTFKNKLILVKKSFKGNDNGMDKAIQA